jgi:hypothetical protein
LIIDGHTHIFPPALRRDREALCHRERGFSSIYGNPKAKMEGVEALIACMGESGVARSLICGFPWEQRDLCRHHNEYLLESASRFSDRLIAFVTLPVRDPDWSCSELERALQAGAKGVGEVAFYEEEMTRGDVERMKPLLDLMIRKNVPLLLHTNETVGHAYPGKGRTEIARFYELALAAPGLPILLAHWGGGLPFYEMMPEVAASLSSVYYDTAASPYLYSKGVYSIVSAMVGPEKIVFGSDFPLLSPLRYFQDVKESGLSQEDQEKILGLNLARLLDLERR